MDAAKAAGIQHFVWTTLDSSELKVPHWETKAAVDEYLKASSVPRTSYVFSWLFLQYHYKPFISMLTHIYPRLYTAFFIENLTTFFGFKRNDAGEVVFDVPLKTDGEIPCVSGYDLGGWALVAFKNPNEWLSKLPSITHQSVIHITI